MENVKYHLAAGAPVIDLFSNENVFFQVARQMEIGDWVQFPEPSRESLQLLYRLTELKRKLRLVKGDGDKITIILEGEFNEIS
jgi:hypothetical protein